MFKIAAFVSLMLIGNLLAGGLSCDSCGNECASACGTRHFRSCCFNYLRRKRGPEVFQVASPKRQDFKTNKYEKPTIPLFVLEEVPEKWFSFLESNDFKPYYVDDTVDSRVQTMYYA